ncbi:hypothetical protein PoB_007526000 [Plakobranchus ocellatus]|uniref:Uncharacterized protein n=1 Tax=Plakobranchus ocellatus TaxID=259542 RepID=A0AAV4DXK9_9GAST|nr:hypothetical protein PoB_007526000 [Plakobranchus ocellatus]
MGLADFPVMNVIWCEELHGFVKYFSIDIKPLIRIVCIAKSTCTWHITTVNKVSGCGRGKVAYWPSNLETAAQRSLQRKAYLSNIGHLSCTKPTQTSYLTFASFGHIGLRV